MSASKPSTSKIQPGYYWFTDEDRNVILSFVKRFRPHTGDDPDYRGDLCGANYVLKSDGRYFSTSCEITYYKGDSPLYPLTKAQFDMLMQLYGGN